MRYSGWLSYRQIECGGCGEKRVAGISCPTCGEAPDEREVDPDRQARQKAAASALEELEHGRPVVPVAPGPEPLEFFDKLSELAESFLASLVEAARDPRHADRLIAAVKALLEAKAEAAAAPRLRPWIAVWRAIDEVLQRLGSVAVHYLLALAADAPLRAQREARLAQAELDAAGDPAAFLGNQVERWSEVERAQTFEQGLVVSAEHAFSRTGAGDLLAFDRAGDEVFKRVTGRTGCPTGLGFGLNVIAQQAEGPFDEARFWEVAGDTYALLAADQHWLADLAADESWVEDFNLAMVSAWDTAVLNEGMTAAVRHDRQAVRVLLDLPEGLVEGPGKVFAATLLAAAKGKGYGTYRGQSAGALIEAARDQHGIADKLLGLDPAIRRASAHQEFGLEGDDVVLTNRGREVERLSREQLLDRAMAAVESVNAIGLGMVCAAVIGGFDPDRLLDVASESLPSEAAAALLLAGAGWRAPEVSIEDGRVSVVGQAELGPQSLPQAAALLPHLPKECRELELKATGPEGPRELRGPVDPLRRFAEATDALEKQVHLMEAHRLWRLEGDPLCTDDHVRKIVSVTAMQRLSQDQLRGGVRLLRVSMAAAQRMGLHDLEEAIRAVLAAIRANAGGMAAPGELEAALRPLVSWGAKRVAPLGG
jgi:hypothetical protein